MRTTRTDKSLLSQQTPVKHVHKIPAGDKKTLITRNISHDRKLLAKPEKLHEKEEPAVRVRAVVFTAIWKCQ